MAACIGASVAGARTFTATSSQGLALMHEMLHWAAGGRHPVVMGDVNRAMAPGWIIWTDQNDTLSQRDTGWMQFYCASNQEVLDTVIQAFKVAETLLIPVMVVLDAFALSHTYEVVDVPDQALVDRYLPPFKPASQADAGRPARLRRPDRRRSTTWSSATSSRRTWRRRRPSSRRPAANSRSSSAAASASSTPTGATTPTSSSSPRGRRATRPASPSTSCAGHGRQGREPAHQGLPAVPLRPRPRGPGEASGRWPSSTGTAPTAQHGIFYQEVKSALYGRPGMPPVFGYIAGLGGRDITPDIVQGDRRRTRWPRTGPKQRSSGSESRDEPRSEKSENVHADRPARGADGPRPPGLPGLRRDAGHALHAQGARAEDGRSASRPAAGRSSTGRIPTPPWTCPIYHCAFETAASTAAGRQGRPGDDRRHGDDGRGLGRRRRHVRHRPPGPVRRGRAERGHHLRLLRQRSLHEHGHPALVGHALRRLDDDDAGQALQDPAEEGHRGHHGRAPHPLHRHGQRLPPRGPRSRR